MKSNDFFKKYSKVKCDCGHYLKDHYANGGYCKKCACTWYWPNVDYMKKEIKSK